VLAGEGSELGSEVAGAAVFVDPGFVAGNKHNLRTSYPASSRCWRRSWTSGSAGLAGLTHDTKFVLREN
jgi:hypothetical protein